MSIEERRRRHAVVSDRSTVIDAGVTQGGIGVLGIPQGRTGAARIFVGNVFATALSAPAQSSIGSTTPATCKLGRLRLSGPLDRQPNLVRRVRRVELINPKRRERAIVGTAPVVPQARFRTFQVCPKDLPAFLRQFAYPAWAGDRGCSASLGCGPCELTLLAVSSTRWWRSSAGRR